MTTAAVLWTGGKDCCLALCRARDSGLAVRSLVTFVPVGPRDFKAHPIEEMQNQAGGLGLPLQMFAVSEPFREGYVQSLDRMRDEMGIDCVITGDIDFVGGYPNWIEECCRGRGITVVRPLWQNDRETLLWEIIDRHINSRITYITESALPTAWLGRRIDHTFVTDIRSVSEQTGIDLCGENGEYHTMVTV